MLYLCTYILFLLLAAHGGGWGYSASSVEAVRFSSDTEVLLGGFGLYGGRGTYNAEIKVKRERRGGGGREREITFVTTFLYSYLTLVRMVVRQKVMVLYWPVTKRLAIRVTGCRPTEFSLRSQFSLSPTTGMWPLPPSAHQSALAQTLALLGYRRSKGQTSKFKQSACLE